MSVVDRLRAALIALTAVFGGCRTRPSTTDTGGVPNGTPPRVESQLSSETWRIDVAWTQFADITVSPNGSITVAGSRLVGDGDSARSEAVVARYAPQGTLLWTQRVASPQSWSRALSLAASEQTVFVAARELTQTADSIIIAALDLDDGSVRWSDRRDLGQTEVPSDLLIYDDELLVAATVFDDEHETGLGSIVARWTRDGTFNRTDVFSPMIPAALVRHDDNVLLIGRDEFGDRVEAVEGSSTSLRDSVLRQSYDVFPSDAAGTDRGVVVVAPRTDQTDSVFHAEPLPSRNWNEADPFEDNDPDVVSVGPSGVVFLAGGNEFGAVQSDGSPYDAGRALEPPDTITAIATPCDGAIVLAGFRTLQSQHRTDGFLIRLETPREELPPYRHNEDTRHITTVSAFRWLHSDLPGSIRPRPGSRDAQRKLATHLLGAKVRTCPEFVENEEPDSRSLETRRPAGFVSLADPCVVLDHIKAMAPALQSPDLPKVREGLAQVLTMYGDDNVDDGSWTIGFLDSVTTAAVRLELASLAFESPTPEVRAHAIKVLESDGGSAAVRLLERVVRDGTCVDALEAALSLEALGHPQHLSTRPEHASAQTLFKRYCMLQAHSDTSLAEAFWKTMLTSSCYEHYERCDGDWTGVDDVLEGCEEESNRTCAETGTSPDERVDCGEFDCSFGSFVSREYAPHGERSTISFAPGPDGELYVDSTERLTWIEY
jgi:hypothetical protein